MTSFNYRGLALCQYSCFLAQNYIELIKINLEKYRIIALHLCFTFISLDLWIKFSA